MREPPDSSPAVIIIKTQVYITNAIRIWDCIPAIYRIESSIGLAIGYVQGQSIQ